MVTKSLVPSLSDLDYSSIIFLPNHPLFFRFILLSNQKIIHTDPNSHLTMFVKFIHIFEVLKNYYILKLMSVSFLFSDITCFFPLIKNKSYFL